jgi:hypothetical protein
MNFREEDPAFVELERRRLELVDAFKGRLPEQKYEVVRNMVENYEWEVGLSIVAHAVVDLGLTITSEEMTLLVELGDPNEFWPFVFQHSQIDANDGEPQPSASDGN